eukprot:Selendium_serpulae@DN4609_c0_g1_i2.p1
MKIDEKIASHQERYGSRPFFSLEVFPPKTEMGLLNLYDRFARFAVMHPIWVDVTWGAGGSTATKTVEICKQLLHYHGLEALIHLTCTNMSVETIDQALDECVANKIVNILALRGDAPTGQQWEAAEGGFNHAVDLLKYIHKRHPGVFCVGVAGYPEGHLENPSKEDDLNRLKEKVDGGASFVITQLFYDCDEYFDFVRRAREIGVPKSVPIIPGVMPIQSYPGFCKMTGFCKTKVPAKLREQLELVKGDEASVKLFGVDHAVEMCRTLIEGGVPGLHFYTLNLEATVSRVLETLQLVDFHLPNRALPWNQMLRDRGQKEDVRPIFWSNNARSFIHRTMSWDEFPNGRWGSRDNPAYGEAFISYSKDPDAQSIEHRADMWGASLTKINDVANVFSKFLKGDAQTKRLPWCSDSLREETVAIKRQLLKLNLLGLLTINSQPRVNGALSTDPVFGWGPKGGFVFQKAYIEFFCSPQIFHAVKAATQKHSYWTFCAIDSAGKCQKTSDFETNQVYPPDNRRQSISPKASRSGDSGSERSIRSSRDETYCTNAVTWGIFPNAEVQQPTVVDEESFRAWAEEAFGLWSSDWGSIYPKESESRKIIDQIVDQWWLVNIVDNNFVSGDLFQDLIVALTNAATEEGRLPTTAKARWLRPASVSSQPSSQ